MDKRIIYALSLGALGACAPIVPPELADARRAYNDAAHGPASTVAPAELHKAEASLTEAERAFRDAPKTQRTRDLAYIADRKAQTADALARGDLAASARHDAERDFTTTQGQIIGAKNAALADTRAQLSDTQRAGDAKSAELGNERTARADAERRATDSDQRAKDAQESLAKLAMVKEVSRGLVITLSGSVLFPSSQSVLLPDAQTRLDQVATALLATKEHKLVIEGYTDSRGSDSYNLDLSRRRAEAVRTYLVAKGYDPDLISADGMGKARPVSDNANAEGRANNRRVEIVVPKRD